MEKDLEIFNTNILKWYDFDENQNLLQVGENNNIFEYLKSKLNNVKMISGTEIVDEKFQYILFYGIENIKNYENIITKNLEEDGKIIIIGNNAFGVNNFSKYVYDGDNSVQFIESSNNSFESVPRLLKKISKLGFMTNSYSVYPNYQKAELIFNEKFDISKSQIEKYSSDLEERDIKVFDEIKILSNIIENDKESLINFCNSFFIEVSKKNEFCDVKYASFNNVRKSKFRLVTLIKDEVVEKRAAEKEAEEHLKQIKDNLENVEKLGFKVLDYSKDNKIYSKLVKNQITLDELFYKNYEDKRFIIKTLKDIESNLLQNSIKYDECKDKITYCNDENILKNLHFLENCYWDLIPKNCFLIDDVFYFFDQEWNKQYLPVEFLIYRSLINCYELVRKIDINEYLNELGIAEYKELFENIDKDLRKEIIDEDIFKVMYLKEVKGVHNYINDSRLYLEELDRKQKYIEDLEKYNKDLEKYTEDLKKDNQYKQERLDKIDIVGKIKKKIKKGIKNAK